MFSISSTAYLYFTLYHLSYICPLFHFPQQVFHCILAAMLFMVKARTHLKVKVGGADSIPFRTLGQNEK